jgi:hypothetical protein
MTFELKLVVFVLVVIGDLLALAFLAPRLVRQGRGVVALILAASVVVSAALVGVVLFLVV